jgi:polysaccharide export outer membrane protein
MLPTSRSSFLSRAIAAAAALSILGACASNEPMPSTAASSTMTARLAWDELTLGPNDVVRVGVYGHPELSAPPHENTASGSRIDGEGNLSLPLVGAVHVAGMTMSDARTAITSAFARYVQDPKIDASVIEYSARRFYLYGEVQKPGAYAFDRPLTLYQALTYGGGYTSRANRDQVILLRGTSPENLEVLRFDAESPQTEGFTALRPDDLVFVRRSGTGKFSDEVLPILTGIASSLSSIATLILIDDQLK